MASPTTIRASSSRGKRGRCSAGFATGWAVQGPGKEVFFEQAHVAGREVAVDFTHATELGVTIAPNRSPRLEPTEKTE